MTESEAAIEEQVAAGEHDDDPSMAKMRPRVERVLRSALAPRRMSAGVAVYVVAALEAVLGEVVESAEKVRGSRRKPKMFVDRAALITGVRKNPALARALRSFVFQPGSAVKYDGDVLLTKSDRAVAQQKRAQAAAEKGAKQAVPGVLEG